MKKILIYIALVCFAITLLGGCDFSRGGPTEHTFLQGRTDVLKVEICTNSEIINWREGSMIDTLHPLAELSNEEIDSLWNALLAFPSAEVNYIESGCGDLLFVFTYADGQKELIGYGEIGVLNPDGTFSKYRSHVLADGKALAKLFARYADVKMLREASKSFNAYYQ